MITRKLLSETAAASMLLSKSVPAYNNIAASLKDRKKIQPLDAKLNYGENGFEDNFKMWEQTKKYESQSAIFEKHMAQALNKLKGVQERIYKENEMGSLVEQNKALTIEEKWSSIIEYAFMQDEEEIKKCNAEVTEWTEHFNKLRVEIAEYISKLNKNLKSGISAIDEKLAVADTEEERKLLAALKESNQKYIHMRKKAVYNHVANLNIFWFEKQKYFKLKRELLTKKLVMNMECRKNMLEIAKAQILEISPQKIS